MEQSKVLNDPEVKEAIIKAATSISNGESYFEALSKLNRMVTEVMYPELKIKRQIKNN